MPERLPTDHRTDVTANSHTDVTAARRTDVAADHRTDVTAHRHAGGTADHRTDVTANRRTDVMADHHTDATADFRAGFRAALARHTAIRTAAGTPQVPTRLVAPPVALRPWVTDVGVTPPDPRGPRSVTHLPDAAVRLVLRTSAGGGSDVLAVGPRTRASYHSGKRLPLCLDLRIRPGAARPLLGVPAAALVGQVVPLTELPGAATARLARELGRLGADTTVDEALAVLAGLLPPAVTPRDPVGRARADLVRAAIARLSTRPGSPRPAPVAEVARVLAVSERQLRALFTEEVGLSPKHFARIDRARQLLAGAAGAAGWPGSPVPWAGLAQATGYYDQSHMTAEFRSLFGVAPKAFVEGRIPAGLPCTARPGR